jgi:predicted transcriptional regulator
MIRKPVVVHPGDTLRMVTNLFVERHITSAPVVGSEDGGKVLGLLTVDQLLDGRLRDLAEKYDREANSQASYEQWLGVSLAVL